jgi:hypothetical protein
VSMCKHDVTTACVTASTPNAAMHAVLLLEHEFGTVRLQVRLH